MKVLRCAICDDKQNLTLLYKENFNFKNFNPKIFSARRTTDNIHYRFNKCLNCGLIFSSPILENNKIIRLYSDSKFNYKQESEYLTKTYVGYYKKYLSRFRNSARILDVGCGNGFFLDGLKDMGLNKLYGVEPSVDAIQKAPHYLQENIKKNVLKENLFPNSYFDVICTFHTLDHVVDPDAFIATAFKMIKNSGAIFIIVHNTDGLSVKVFGEKSPIFDIEHIFLFNKSNIKQILAKNGFKKAIVFDVKNNYPLSYWLRMSPVPNLVKSPLLSILKNVKRLDIPLSLSAGNIGVIAFK